jgi:hypothetical protein
MKAEARMKKATVATGLRGSIHHPYADMDDAKSIAKKLASWHGASS